MPSEESDGLTEMTEQAFAVLIAEGISAADFWDMSWHEIMLVTNALKEKREKEQVNDIKTRAQLAWKTSELITCGVNIAFRGTKSAGEFPSLFKAFPKLFEDERAAQSLPAPADDRPEWMRLREQMSHVAIMHNKARRGR